MFRSTKARVTLAGAVLLAALTAVPALAQDEEKEKMEVGRWYSRVEAGLNLTQSAFSDNWKGGGSSALSWTATFDGGLQKKFENDLHWSNNLRLRFGQTHNKREREDGSSGWDKPEKTDDKIDFETLLLLQRGWEVDPYVSGRWESFFVDESDPLGRDIFVNPSTFRESAGIARHFLDRGETEFILARFGATARQSFRRFYENDFNDDIKLDGGVDGGLELQGDWRLLILQDKVAWRSKLSVYQPFWWSKADEYDKIPADSLAAAGIATNVKDYTTTVDAAWENTFSTQITKWIAFNFYVEFVYDKYDNSVIPEIDENGMLTNPEAVSSAIRKSVQWKQTFGVGITYNFKS